MRCLAFFVTVSGLGLSVWFEPNQGQVHRSVEFMARSGGVLCVLRAMAVLDVRMDLIGANRKAEVEFDDPTGEIGSYFIGRTEKDWHTGIPHYARTRYRDVYSGIDLQVLPDVLIYENIGYPEGAVPGVEINRAVGRKKDLKLIQRRILTCREANVGVDDGNKKELSIGRGSGALR